jgi:hypothetical protein
MSKSKGGVTVLNNIAVRIIYKKEKQYLQRLTLFIHKKNNSWYMLDMLAKSNFNSQI